MNTYSVPPSSPVPAGDPGEPASPQPSPPRADDAPLRHRHRQRDFGIGYGNSSGYGVDVHYVDGHEDPIFRFT